jgi:DNA-binding NtrC family response regulator
VSATTSRTPAKLPATTQTSRSHRSVMLVSANGDLRKRLRVSLTGMRWDVSEANGGAEAMSQMEEFRPEALLMDHWLPDLEAGEFARQVSALYPGVDVLLVDGESMAGGVKSPRRNELLHALREAAEPKARDTRARDIVASDTAAWKAAPVGVPLGRLVTASEVEMVTPISQNRDIHPSKQKRSLGTPDMGYPVSLPESIEEMVGRSAVMMELTRLIRLVAPTSATVLIEGETGTGKEVVAHAVHRLSARANKPFCVLNCAAIPEALLEAELFGHTRGAFTGAVTSRTGRIEAAHGGTLFLDEIGEMPVGLQAKLLRFLECGELQRVGENEVIRVDVRVVAATHQDLEKGTAEGKFRLDLYHRLAVFPVVVPPLRERMEDLPALVEFFLAMMGKNAPRARISGGAMARLNEHDWPGNVRELGHVLERGAILAGNRAEIGVEEIRLRGLRS